MEQNNMYYENQDEMKEYILSELNKAMSTFVGLPSTESTVIAVKNTMQVSLSNIYSKYFSNDPIPKIFVEVDGRNVTVILIDPETGEAMTLGEILNALEQK